MMKILETISIEQDNVNDESVVIKNLYFESGDFVEPESLLLDYETSKASHEMVSSSSGYVQYLCDVEDIIDVGKVIIKISDEKVDELIIPTSDKVTQKSNFTKKALERMKQLGLSESMFAAFERVTTADIEELYALKKDYSDIIKLSPTKKEEIKNLFDPAKATLVSTVAKNINSKSLDLDILYDHSELTNSILPVIIKEISSIFEQDKSMNVFNAFFDEDKLYIYKDINAGIALNFGDGLRVGVIKHANKKSLAEIEESLLDLIDKYIERKLTSEDISDATFTVTDLTDQNINSFIPLIKNKNSMMIGICGEQGGIQSISATFDHRAADGLVASKFLNMLIDVILDTYSGVSEIYSCSRCMKTLEELAPGNNLQGLIAIVDENSKSGYICETCLDGN
jgi:pyruvate/2-oxoglutarate dehydrogenase complex dihydrolipoamide acyltransferase (E2) component